MEEIIDLEDFFKDFVIPEHEFAVVYDEITGKVISVGPVFAFNDIKNKVVVDKEVALDIIENRISIDRCFIDPRTKKPIITEVRSLQGIDDILHRVIDIKWASGTKFDLYISYNFKQKMLKFQLAEELGGTKKLPKSLKGSIKNNIQLEGETKMDFMITDYNDPNVEYESFSVFISELIGKTKTFKNVELPEHFSVYTCRLFEKYVLEVK